MTAALEGYNHRITSTPYTPAGSIANETANFSFPQMGILLRQEGFPAINTMADAVEEEVQDGSKKTYKYMGNDSTPEQYAQLIESVAKKFIKRDFMKYIDFKTKCLISQKGESTFSQKVIRTYVESEKKYVS